MADQSTLTWPASLADDGRRVSLWERLSFQVTRLFLYVVWRTVSLSGLYQVGRAFATMEWLINYKRRRRFARRLMEVYGGELASSKRRRATWRHFVRTRCDKLFYLIFDDLPQSKILERFEIINRHLLDEALARGRGVYVALSHLGAHHVAGMLLVEAGYKVAGVRYAQEGAMHRYIQEKYEQANRDRVRYFHSDSYPRRLYRCFEENFVLGSAADVSRVRGGHLKTIEVGLFGQRRAFLAGPMQIAMRCGAPAVQGFLISGKNFHYVFELQGPLFDGAAAEARRHEGTKGRREGRDARDESAALGEALKTYAANLERFARRYPCHVSRI